MGQRLKMRSSLKGLLSTAEPLPSASTRRFYRTKEGIVLLGTRSQISEYLRYHRLLSDLDLPQIIESHDRYLLIEDLGPDRLDSLEHPPYELVIDELIRWQEATERKRAGLPTFNYTHLIWEQNYFFQYVLIRYLKKEPTPRLKSDLEKLAQAIDRLPKVLMHRDFQSRNIFIKDGRVRIIDFQNAMIGPVSYDLASLLFDPYHPIGMEQIQELLKYYNQNSPWSISPPDLFKTGIQRLLQATGAYVFLTLIRGLDYSEYLKIGLEMIRRLEKEIGIDILCGTKS